jgi:hypothetical protein
MLNKDAGKDMDVPKVIMVKQWIKIVGEVDFVDA